MIELNSWGSLRETEVPEEDLKDSKDLIHACNLNSTMKTIKDTGECEKGKGHDVDTPQNINTQLHHTKNKNKKPFSCIKEKKIYAKFLNSIYIETSDIVNKTHTHDSNFAPTKNTEHQTL